VFPEGNRIFVHSNIFGDFVVFKRPRFPTIEVEVTSNSGYSAVMPGKILQVLVKDGDSVTEGQPLVIMESMKMESKIYAKGNGVVKIFVKVGDIVEKDTTLASVEDN